jgi:hypothetical protein
MRHAAVKIVRSTLLMKTPFQKKIAHQELPGCGRPRQYDPSGPVDAKKALTGPQGSARLHARKRESIVTF